MCAWPKDDANQSGIVAKQGKALGHTPRNNAEISAKYIQAFITVKQDSEGRYCLNDLHKAAGEQQKDQPRYFLATQNAQDLLKEISGNPLVSKTGRNGGTYVCKELVYAYAMWISPAFNLKIIRPFDFNSNQIRVVTIDNQPWFVATDVCKTLGFNMSAGAAPHLSKLDAGERHLLKACDLPKSALGKAPSVSLISESGLYKLIMRSDKPEAKGFQDWVTKVVLPAIRKDGGYIQGVAVAEHAFLPSDFHTSYTTYRCQMRLKPAWLRGR